MTYQVRNFDWHAAWRVGEDMAKEQVRRGDPIDARAIMWALTCEAAKTSAAAYQSVPRSTWPTRALLPETPPEVSQWQLIGAYLRGELDEMPADDSAPPRPSAAQISRAEQILWLWHEFALTTYGDWKRMRKAIYMKAQSFPDQKILKITGFSRQRVHKAKQRAMDDMCQGVKAFGVRI